MHPKDPIKSEARRQIGQRGTERTNDQTLGQSPKSVKSNVFTVINNVRDMCKQPDNKKLLMFTLATYCDRDGICWPKNDTLVAATAKSDRTVRRMLQALAEEGELQILTTGIGRDTKRVIYLKRYAKPDKAMTAKPDKAMSGLNRTCPPGKVIVEQPYEQPHEQPNVVREHIEQRHNVVREHIEQQHSISSFKLRTGEEDNVVRKPIEQRYTVVCKLRTGEESPSTVKERSHVDQSNNRKLSPEETRLALAKAGVLDAAKEIAAKLRDGTSGHAKCVAPTYEPEPIDFERDEIPF